MDFYYKIPDYPDRISSTTIITRMLDGLGFRFYWATEGLRPEDYKFRPAPDTMSIEELIIHVWELVNWVSDGAFGKPYTKPKRGDLAREKALAIIQDLRTRFLAINDDELIKLKLKGRPFWHMVNGPFSDALTHTGQINSFRRVAGNPVKRANVFTGTPPEEK